MDRRAGMNGSLVVDRRLKWIVGRGWVVVGFAPVGFKSAGFQIVVGSWLWFAPVVFGFQIGSGDDFF